VLGAVISSLGILPGSRDFPATSAGTQFPTAGHLVSRAKLSPRTIQSVARSSAGKTGKGNP
jgi:hypothetical protein